MGRQCLSDGSAGDADYRQPEPRIAKQIVDALGDARTVVNVGAGAGSYEPRDRAVTAVEPSASMRAQRPVDAPPAIDAVADNVPFSDKSVDAAMATFTIPQWDDLERGLREMLRVSTGPVVILTYDPVELGRFWLADYAPEVISTEVRRYPAIARVTKALGAAEVIPVPISLDCVNGFGEAYYGRPEMLLDPGVRRANSAWSFIDETVAAAYVSALRTDLETGAWDAKYGHLCSQPTFKGSLYLIVARPNRHR